MFRVNQMRIQSSAFENRRTIIQKHTCHPTNRFYHLTKEHLAGMQARQQYIPAVLVGSQERL